jgi:outer membrane PBP1 activator LpoA protein
MRRALAVLALALVLSGCTPREGGRCTTVGQVIADADGGRLQCFTDSASDERAPHWHGVP